jgi:hypothetical protein
MPTPPARFPHRILPACGPDKPNMFGVGTRCRLLLLGFLGVQSGPWRDPLNRGSPSRNAGTASETNSGPKEADGGRSGIHFGGKV